MKKHYVILAQICLIFLVGCADRSSETWEDMKTAGNYALRGVDHLLGNDFDSRLLSSEDDFFGPDSDDFIPLSDQDLRSSFASTDLAVPQSRMVPGRGGVPSLDQFYQPDDSVASHFRKVHYDTDDSVVRDPKEVQHLMGLAQYLKKNPGIYVLITGHCDERGSASYNMALGLRRANYVRGFLVKQGVDMNRIFTVSKGKEDPIAQGHRSEDWKKNRRSEFKIYER
jgi:peptidoglycan-associated lipoprotein